MKNGVIVSEWAAARENQGLSAVKIRFLSSNAHKISEVKEILSPMGIEAVAVARKIDEIHTDDVNRLIRDKAIKAFEIIGRPLFVEHTGLYTEALKGLPGGLTQVFWDTLKEDAVSEIFAKLNNQIVIAKTHIAFIDGRSIKTFLGEVSGKFSDTPRGPADFQWDCVFVPDGSTETFAEMGDRKNAISMRRIALNALAEELASHA